MSDRLEKARERLRASSLKVTAARSRVLDYLVKHHGPFKIEELHSGLGKADFDLVTLYRVLNSFEKAGLISRFQLGDSTARYEFADPDHHHHHVVCRVCQRVDEIALCPFEFSEKQIEKMGYSSIDHAATFYGICSGCASESAQAH